MLKGETEMNLFGKKFALVLALIAVLAMAGSALAADVTDENSLRQQVKTGGEITLTRDIELRGSGGDVAINITKNTVLDLNGHTLSRTSDEADYTFVIIVQNDATLTINDSSNGNGKIVSTNNNNENAANGYARVVRIGSSAYEKGDGTGGSVIMNGGSIISTRVADPKPDAWGGYGVVLYAQNSSVQDAKPIAVNFTMNGGKIDGGWAGIAAFGTSCKVTVNGGEIIAPGYAIAGNGNGNNNGTMININGGALTSEKDVAIYHPQDGVMTVSGGTITGQDGIQMVGGELNITGGTIRAIGEYSEKYEKEGDGSILGGAALSILSRANYVGGLVVNISGTPTLESKNGNAIAEATVNDANEDHFETLTIAGGTFTGAANQAAIATYFAKPGDIKITAGTFSSHIKDIFPDNQDAFSNIEIAEDNGKFYVVIHSESISLPATKEMTVGTSERLEVTFTPENTTETTLTWSSSDGSIVTVDGNGIVTAVSVGTADITATAENGKTATCNVTVIAGAPQHSSGGGGGCSAGFGALALLAAVPLMFRRKK